MRFHLILLLGVLMSFNVLATDIELKQAVHAGLSRLIPDVTIDRVRATPIEGLYEVIIGPDVIYMTPDGSYVFKGELLDVNNKRNLTEDVRSEERAKLFSHINKDEYIEFASKNKQQNKQSVIYVFTDIDCSYCRKLHRDITELNAKGINVRYLAYPRAGIGSKTGQKMRHVWCADNRQKAITDAKNSRFVKAKSCNDPIAKQYELGQQLDIRGTPAIFSENGKMFSGYMPPNELLKQLQH